MKFQIVAERVIIGNFNAEIDYDEKIINNITLPNDTIIECVGFDELPGLINCLQIIKNRIKERT